MVACRIHALNNHEMNVGLAGPYKHRNAGLDIVCELQNREAVNQWECAYDNAPAADHLIQNI